tara:strand:- start:532 stop:1002 length:471 start_codon:yes stop_codon:yes gene_type:complete
MIELADSHERIDLAIAVAGLTRDFKADLYDEESLEGFKNRVGDSFDVVGGPKKDEDCFFYAMGVKYRSIGAENRGFLSWFRDYVGQELSEIMPGCVVGYFDAFGESDENPQLLHVGLATEDLRVRSRWGTDGPVIIHNLDRLPHIYGNQARFFGRK